MAKDYNWILDKDKQAKNESDPNINKITILSMDPNLSEKPGLDPTNIQSNLI